MCEKIHSVESLFVSLSLCLSLRMSVCVCLYWAEQPRRGTDTESRQQQSDLQKYNRKLRHFFHFANSLFSGLKEKLSTCLRACDDNNTGKSYDANPRRPPELSWDREGERMHQLFLSTAAAADDSNNVCRRCAKPFPFAKLCNLPLGKVVVRKEKTLITQFRWFLARQHADRYTMIALSLQRMKERKK